MAINVQVETALEKSVEHSGTWAQTILLTRVDESLIWITVFFSAVLGEISS
jgi:hypothetical protein